MRKILKIAYVTTFDPSDIHAWSGTLTYIHKALKSSGFQTETIGNLREKDDLLYKFKKQIYARVFSKRYLKSWEPSVHKNYSNQVKQADILSSCDLIFSPLPLPITYLHTEKPIVTWRDATFAGVINFHPNFYNLCPETIKNGNKLEQLALSKSRISIFASEWAANSALQNYDIDPAKVKVVPFGANIICNRTVHDIHSIVEQKDFGICKLVLLGTDWSNKGGDFAVRVADLLNQRGIKTELHIVGCDPKIKLPDFVKVHGFVSKKTEEGRIFLDKMLTVSHFLIVPSRADCFGIVFAEASSFGLPSLATNVGGIPAVIHNGKNGQTFSLDEVPEKYCDYIEKYMSSKQAYKELALTSFGEYAERLNWTSAGKKVFDLIQEYCI